MPSDPYENHDAALPEPVREHLGQQLRSVYNVQAEKPDYLGDPGLPPEFTPQLRRLGTRQQTVSEWETGSSHPRAMARRLLHIVAEEGGFYSTERDGNPEAGTVPPEPPMADPDG